MHTERYTASRGKEVLLHTNLIATRKTRPTNILTISIVIIITQCTWLKCRKIVWGLNFIATCGNYMVNCLKSGEAHPKITDSWNALVLHSINVLFTRCTNSSVRQCFTTICKWYVCRVVHSKSWLPWLWKVGGMSTQWMKYDMNTLKWSHFPINHSSMISTRGGWTQSCDICA